mgnify:CR=1 FL=1
MAITLNGGTGVITGLTALPDGIVTNDDLAGSIADGKITGLSASKLTGALPAISGASLTGITTGKVLQVVSTTKTDPFSTNTTSWPDITGLSVSITPSATTSKVLVFYEVMRGNGNGVITLFRLMRDSTAIGLGGADGLREQVGRGWYAGVSDHTWHFASVSQTYLDSPSTTSATTYKVQCRPNSGYLYVNRQGNDTNADYVRRASSSITAIEIGA